MLRRAGHLVRNRGHLVRLVGHLRFQRNGVDRPTPCLLLVVPAVVRVLVRLLRWLLLSVPSREPSTGHLGPGVA